MKIYTLLESNKGLFKIITYPEKPDSDMELFFDNFPEKSVIANQEIWTYVQSAVITELLGKNLALAIASDYPHLFKKPLDFFSQDPASTSDELFSCLTGDVKAITIKRLEKLDEQIARAPHVLKLKIDRADLLREGGEFQRAQLEYIALSSLCTENTYYELKIKRGLSACEQEIQKAGTIFQTPFAVVTVNEAKEHQPVRQPQNLSTTHEQQTHKNRGSNIFNYRHRLDLKEIEDPYPSINNAEAAYFKFDFDSLKDNALHYPRIARIILADKDGYVLRKCKEHFGLEEFQQWIRALIFNHQDKYPGIGMTTLLRPNLHSILTSEDYLIVYMKVYNRRLEDEQSKSDWMLFCSDVMDLLSSSKSDEKYIGFFLDKDIWYDCELHRSTLTKIAKKHPDLIASILLNPVPCQIVDHYQPFLALLENKNSTTLPEVDENLLGAIHARQTFHLSEEHKQLNEDADSEVQQLIFMQVQQEAVERQEREVMESSRKKLALEEEAKKQQADILDYFNGLLSHPQEQKKSDYVSDEECEEIESEDIDEGIDTENDFLEKEKVKEKGSQEVYSAQQRYPAFFSESQPESLSELMKRINITPDPAGEVRVAFKNPLDKFQFESWLQKKHIKSLSGKQALILSMEEYNSFIGDENAFYELLCCSPDGP